VSRIKLPKERDNTVTSKKKWQTPAVRASVNPHTMKDRKDERKRTCANDCVESSQRRTMLQRTRPTTRLTPPLRKMAPNNGIYRPLETQRPTAHRKSTLCNGAMNQAAGRQVMYDSNATGHTACNQDFSLSCERIRIAKMRPRTPVCATRRECVNA